MVRITFVGYTGQEATIDVEEGLSLMEAARRAGIPGIDGACGGECACATCKVNVIGEEWAKRVGQAESHEREMLDFGEDCPATVRLSCQIRARRELDGLRLQLPDRQDGGRFPSP